MVNDRREPVASLALLLNLAGNETQTAYDGREALAAAAAFQSDVVLLEHRLPELNGYEVARKIRNPPWGETMLLVALTGWVRRQTRVNQ